MSKKQFVWIAFAILVGSLAFAVNAQRNWQKAHLLNVCNSQLERIHDAIVAYRDRHGHYPRPHELVDGQPSLSWRVLILPELGHETLFREFRLDQPWNSPHNKKLISRMPDVYQCPCGHSTPTSTSYLGFVDPFGAFRKPSSEPAKTGIGARKTILVIETSEDVPWTKPHDFSVEEYWHSPTHDEKTRVLYDDGRILNLGTKDVQREFFTMNSTPASTFLPPVVSAEALSTTSVMPFLDAPIEPGKNIVYCGSFKLATADARLPVASTFQASLHKHVFEATDVSSDSVVVMNGTSQQIVDHVQEKLGMPVELPPNLSQVMFACLQKTLPFQEKFLRTDDLAFNLPGERRLVHSFGFRDFFESSIQDTLRKNQIAIHDYVSDNDFVIELISTATDDQIITAKVAPQASLAETIESVRNRLVPPKKTSKLLDGEAFIFPVISIGANRDYTSELGAPAFQVIQFRLDEAGAILRSFGGYSCLEGDKAPRKMVFDRPFLLYLCERTSKRPYFAAWIENTELLEECVSHADGQS